MVDWYPTLIGRAGGSLEQKLPIDGKDIWEVLTKGAKSPHEDILFNVTPKGRRPAQGDWKLVLNGNNPDNPDGKAQPKKGKKGMPLVELFNLANDPSEKTNLAEANRSGCANCAPAGGVRAASRATEGRAQGERFQVAEGMGRAGLSVGYFKNRPRTKKEGAS